MRAIAFLLLGAFAATGALGAGSALDAARDALQAIGAQPVGVSTKYKGPKIKYAGCPRVPPGKWAGLLLLNQPVEHEYKFGDDCDLEGKVVFKRSGFPVDLKLRGFPVADRIQAQVKMDAVPELSSGTMSVAVSVNDIKLTQAGKESLAGTSDYALTLDLAGEPTDNRGGTFKIARFRGAKSSGSVRYKLYR